MGFIFKKLLLCKGVFIFTYVADIACKIAYAVFNCLRVFGITQSQWLPAMIVFTLSIFDPAINIVFLLAAGYLHLFRNLSIPVITRVVSVAADATILYFTLYVTWRTLKTALKSKSPFTLTSMLLINGSIQFGILLVLNVIAAILDLRSAIVTLGNSGQDASSFVAIQQILNSILLSHFILDLRSIYAIGSKPSDSSQSSYKTETVQFAAHIQSNLGASLDSSWATGEESTFEEVDKIQYSDNPLVTGLLESTRGCETSIKLYKLVTVYHPLALMWRRTMNFNKLARDINSQFH
ncbi:hypothetical protein QCA50_004077 [Cerrena zonata]|uniref:Uncharacterized protein n=1 Tax=Cerrena zonata TaxID=2478898 RepID=A0AAW0GIF3_9APHY